MSAYDFASASLTALDELQAEVIVLPFFADERPLRGAAGWVDWRTCGALSRRLLAGYIDGRFGEKSLLASPPKLEAESILLVGLGHSRSFELRVAQRACALIAATIAEGSFSTVALALPGRSMGLISAPDAMQIWLSQSRSIRAEEVTIVEEADAHRALAALFDGLRRQAESPLA